MRKGYTSAIVEGMTSQYEDQQLWKLTSDEWGRDYVSVPTQVPTTWTLLHGWPDRGVLLYKSGTQYEIRAHRYGTRRSYTVWRKGVELPLALYSRLLDAKKRAIKNARGLDRMHVA